MRNYNWIADLLFGMGLALFFILVTSDVFADSKKTVKHIQVLIGSDRYVGSYDVKQQKFTMQKRLDNTGKYSFREMLESHGINTEKVIK